MISEDALQAIDRDTASPANGDRLTDARRQTLRPVLWILAMLIGVMSWAGTAQAQGPAMDSGFERITGTPDLQFRMDAGAGEATTERKCSGSVGGCFEQSETSFEASVPVEFDLITYNIKMLGLTANKNRERAEQMIPKLGGDKNDKEDNFDVIVMQEAYTGPPRKILLRGRAKLPFKRKGGLLNAYKYRDHAYKNGILVISNWPIVDQEWEKFDKNPGGRARGVLYTEIDTDATSNFHVFSTHLWWDKNWSGKTLRSKLPSVNKCEGYALDESVRVEQLKEIDDFIASRDIPDGEPVFIAGDFNFGGPGDSRYQDCRQRADVKSYQELKSYLNADELTHVAYDDHSKEWPGTTHGKNPRSLDHVFHRNVSDLDRDASYIERRVFKSGLDLGKSFRRDGHTHLSDHDPVVAHYVFNWGWDPEEPTAKLPEGAKGWYGTYEGRNDGRRARLELQPDAEGTRVEITFEDLDRGTELSGTAYPSQFEESPVHILENLELTNGGCTSWSPEGKECVRKTIDRLFLHTWDDNHISGYSEWKDTHYGMAFSKRGVSSSAQPGGKLDKSRWPYEWTGTYRGRQDGRKAKLTIEQDGSRLRLTLEGVERGTVFTGSVANESQPLHALENIQLTNDDGDVKRIERLLLHTWDTNYISGHSQWKGTDYGNYFVRTDGGGTGG